MDLSEQFLAVRSFTSTAVFAVKPKHSSTSKSIPAVQLIEMAKFLPSDVGNGPVVDIVLCHSTPEAGLLVNKFGGIYSYNLDSEGRRP